MIVKLVSFDKMINFTFSLRLRLVDLLTLYAPAYFFYKPSHVRTATNVAILCLFVFFQRARVAWHVLRQSYGMRTLAYPTLCIIISLCSLASLVDRAYGPSPENPNAVRGDRNVKAHLKPCNNILTDIESIDSERKLLLSRAGKSTGKVIFSVIERRLTCKSYKLLTHLLLLL